MALLALPSEILGLIIEHLAPPGERDLNYAETTGGELDLEDIASREWRSTACSLRLASTRFSQLDFLSSVLFHTFHLWCDELSLANFQRVAESGLRKHVRRVVFMTPHFCNEYQEYDTYEGLVISDAAMSFRTSEALYHASASDISYLDMQQGHEAYQKALREQDEVLLRLPGLLKSILPMLPRLSTLVLCGGNGSLPGYMDEDIKYCNGVRPTAWAWDTTVARRYPTILAKLAQLGEQFAVTAKHKLVQDVLEGVIAARLVRPLEAIICTQSMLLTPSAILPSASFTAFTGLRVLNLTFCRNGPTLNQDWSASVLPLIRHVSGQLEELSLASIYTLGRGVRSSEGPTNLLDVVLEYSFAKLRRLKVKYVCTFSATILPRFIRQHTWLKENYSVRSQY